MNKETKFIVVVLVFVLCICCLPEVAEAGHAVDVQENWRLGMQAWSFNRFTFYEAVEKTAALGLSYIEAYPGQPLSKEKPNIVFLHNMPANIREEVKQKLKDAGVKLVNYGVIGLLDDEAQCRNVFDFAKDMGIETIVSEPPPEAFDVIERLCKEYKIKVAIHNHPKPSRYWHPDKVLAVCKGRSSWIGACADTGHWMRSEVNPVEALKKLEGRIISLHFKDVDEGHDCVWGTGVGNVKAMLAELDRQNFKGVFSIEYEYHWENSMPEIAECIRYFDQVAAKLGQARRQRLFNGKDLTGWEVKGEASKSKWTVGVAEMSTDNPKMLIVKKGKGEMINAAVHHGDSIDIYSKARFGDCRIELELMVPKGSNSGIYVMGEYEVQVLDSYGRDKMGSGDMGAIYGAAVPPFNACKKPGEWQKYVIEFRAPRFDAEGKKIASAKFIKVELNGQVLHENLEMPGPTPAGLTGKEAPIGPIMFQGNHGPVAYRNIWIVPLDNSQP